MRSLLAAVKSPSSKAGSAQISFPAWLPRGRGCFLLKEEQGFAPEGWVDSQTHPHLPSPFQKDAPFS